MFLVILLFTVSCYADFSADKSPFSQNARFDKIDRNQPLSSIRFLFDGFANIVSDSFRYYLANPYRHYRNYPLYPSPSLRYQRLITLDTNHEGRDGRDTTVVVTAPTCPVNNDPKPCGGAICTKDLDCNSVNQGGLCNFNSTNQQGTIGSCICANGWGNPNCSYRRTSKDLVGGLQIGLVFVGVGGVGNFILGYTGTGVGQLLLMLGYYLCCISICLLACELIVPGIVLIVAAGAAYLAGFIWSIVDGAFMLQCQIPDAAGYALF